MQPEISVIIPTGDDFTRLEHTLRGFLRQECQVPFEVVVINDGGSDRTRQMMLGIHKIRPDLPLQYHYLGPPSQEFRAAATRNLGVRAAQGSRLVFADCDTVPAVGFLDAHLGAPEAVLVGLRRRIAQEAVEDLALPWAHEGWYQAHVWAEDERTTAEPFRSAYQALPGGAEPHIIFWSCNLSMPTEALRAIGGFDEAYVGWGGEDEDLGIRLKAHGLEFRRTDATVYHLDHDPRTPRTASELLKVTRHQGVVRNGGPLEPIAPKYL